jgi:excisionase family DNA binding protein
MTPVDSILTETLVDLKTARNQIPGFRPSDSTLRRWITNGKIRAVRVGARKLYVSTEEIKRFIARCNKPEEELAAVS